MYRTDFWTLWEKARAGCLERIALKQVYYQVWNRSPAQVGCLRQVLRASALGRPRGMGWRGSWEGESGWGTHVNPWLIHVNVWQKPVQYCKVISLQLIKINEKKKNCLQSWGFFLIKLPFLPFELSQCHTCIIVVSPPALASFLLSFTGILSKFCTSLPSWCFPPWGPELKPAPILGSHLAHPQARATGQRYKSAQKQLTSLILWYFTFF